MLILDQKNLDLKRLINIQKCRSSTKVDHCGMQWWMKKGSATSLQIRMITLLSAAIEILQYLNFRLGIQSKVQF